MVYLVTYDLRKPKQNYQGLYEELKRSLGWWHYLDSTWLIATSESAADIFHRLAIYLDTSDNILIIQVTKNYYGWLPKESHAWLQQTL